MTTIITSQHYLNDEIVAAKLAAADYAVTLSPAFEVDGETYAVLLDGHHSLAAAIQAGQEPDVTIADASADDRIGVLESAGVESFLEACHMGDGDYIDARTRQYVW